MRRRDFLRRGAAATAALAAAPPGLAGQGGGGGSPSPSRCRAPEVLTRRTVRPLVISDVSGSRYRNGGPESAVERALRGILEGEDVLDALVAGVSIPEDDPEETGIGFGGLPNGDGAVQLDCSVMHGPRRWAGAVAGLEGVRNPSRVARAVAELTDHHLLAGEGARTFARQVGFDVDQELSTPRSRELWLEWRRRVDPSRWLDPRGRLGGEEARSRADAWLRAGLEMVEEGLIPAHSFWGTVNCNGITPTGDMAGVTSTSGLAWKIPGRIGDSPILGAGLYVDNAVGAAGSTGRGEANLFNLSSFLIVEGLRQGLHPKDAGMAALERIRSNTVEERLLREDGTPAFDVRFFILDKAGRYAGVAMWGTAETHFAVCDENGLREEELESYLGRD